MSFSERSQSRRPSPPRDRYEDAPPALRALLLELMQDRWGNRQAYNVLCSVAHVVPDPKVIGDNTAYRHVVNLLDHLEWYEVFDLLERVGPPGRNDAAVNARFASCGLAYQMVDNRIELLDPSGQHFDTSTIEHETTSLLDGRYEPVRQQYEKAVAALNGRPADLEKAVSEAVGALEAVSRIVSDQKEFRLAIDVALRGREGAGGLAQSLKSLYGWASQVPGARHGRHSEPDLTVADARFTVRIAGVAIAYLIGASQ